MRHRAQRFRLGLFILVSGALFVTLVGYFTTRRFLQETDPYYIAYHGVSVGGLQEGSSVKYLGIKVGIIESIRIDPKDIRRVIVKVALEPNTPIKADVHADIAAVGITGLKTIEISGGSNPAPFLVPGDTIPPGSSMTEAISGRAEIIATKLEQVLINLQEFTRPENLAVFTDAANQTSLTFARLDTLLAENRQQVTATLAVARDVAARLDTTSRYLTATTGRINRLVASDTLGQILAGASDITRELQEADLVTLIRQLGEVVERTNRLLVQMDQDFNRGSRDFATSMRKLEAALSNTVEATRLIRQDPSSLVRGTSIKNPPDDELAE